MSSPGYGENGSVVGPQNLATTSAANGIWTLGELTENMRNGTWPMPFLGWMAEYAPNVTGSSTTNSSSFALDSSNNIVIGATTTISATSKQQGMIGKISSDGALLSTHAYTIGSPSSISFRLFGLAVSPTNNIYFSGDIGGSGISDGVYRTKLNSSLVEQWFNNISDELMFITNGGPTYANNSMCMRLSPDGGELLHQAYGLFESGYNLFSEPVIESTGRSAPATNSSYKCMIDRASSTNMGSNIRCLAMTNSRMFQINWTYHSSYGGYQNPMYIGGNMQTNAPASGTMLRLCPSGTGSFNGNYFGAMVANGYHSNTKTNAFNFIGAVANGTYANQMSFAHYDYSASWNTFSQETQFIVNASDSPASPTSLSPYGMALSSDDSTVYILAQDNGNTPSQNYLIKFTPATSTIEWQRKILITKTGEGSGTQQAAYTSNLQLDSTDEYLNLVFDMTNSSVNQNKLVVMKLPVDGDGTGTWTVGDYTVVYGASNITKTSNAIIHNTNANTMSTITAHYAGDPGTAATASMSGTVTDGSK